jgi:hypothetical protein
MSLDRIQAVVEAVGLDNGSEYVPDRSEGRKAIHFNILRI